MKTYAVAALYKVSRRTTSTHILWIMRADNFDEAEGKALAVLTTLTADVQSLLVKEVVT